MGIAPKPAYGERATLRRQLRKAAGKKGQAGDAVHSP